MKIENLKGRSFGCIVSGLLEGDLGDASLRARLRQLWIERGLLIFRDGDSHPAFHVGLSRVFGEL
jgi:taurine dioxygenase